jgi:uncharacterized membrane protein affecting hemolysin expression
MARFRDLSIRRKLLFINVLTTSVALLLASTAFITYERLRFQEDTSRQLNTVADVIATNAWPALAAGNRVAGAEVLRGLAAEPRILAACLYPDRGAVLACYARDPARQRFSRRLSGLRGFKRGTAICCFPGPSWNRGSGSAPCGFVSTARYRSMRCGTMSPW